MKCDIQVSFPKVYKLTMQMAVVIDTVSHCIQIELKQSAVHKPLVMSLEVPDI